MGLWVRVSDQLMKAVYNNYIEELTIVLRFWKTCKWMVRVRLWLWVWAPRSDNGSLNLRATVQETFKRKKGIAIGIDGKLLSWGH